MSDFSTTPMQAAGLSKACIRRSSSTPSTVTATTAAASPATDRASTEAHATAPTLNTRQIVLSTLLGLGLLAAIIAVIGYWFRGPLLAISHAFVQTTGGPGIALGFFLPDAFTIPLPNDAFGMFGLAGGVPFWEVTGWATLGSVLGGSTGWLIGKTIRHTRWLASFMKGRGAQLAGLTRRYGVVVVAIAAVTPLPYSVSAWAAGAVEMPFPTFFAVSLLRFFRVVGALYLIELGLAGTG